METPATNERTRRRLALAASTGAALLLAVLTLYNGTSVVDAPTDVFMLLGQAWRMTLGQVPHKDFHNPIGVVTYALVQVGMALGGRDAGALPIASVLLMVAAVAWASWIAYERYSPVVACGLVGGITLMSLATRALGDGPRTHTYAMLYNRAGWMVFGLLALQAFVPPREPAPGRASREALSLGVLAGLLAYIKISHAAFGFLALAIAWGTRAELRRARPTLAALAGALVVCAGLWLATGVDPFSYLKDVSAALVSQSVGGRLGRARDSVENGSVPLVLMSLAWAALIFRRVWASRAIAAREARVTVQFAYLCAAGLVISASNSGEGPEIPLYAFAGLVLLANSDLATEDRWRPLVVGGILVSILSSAGPIAGRDALSIADTTLWRGYRVCGVEASQRFDAPPLRKDLVVPSTSTQPTQYWAARDMPERLNDGLALLRRHVTPESRVFNVAITDPFSFALGLTPPTGGLLWWDRNLSYAPGSPPAAEAVFRDVTLIMIPVLKPTDRGCCRDPLEDMPVMYGAYWAAHFDEVDRARFWRLLARKP
jgi:hypothetical protein